MESHKGWIIQKDRSFKKVHPPTFISKTISYTLESHIWQYSKNLWICVDTGSLTSVYKNARMYSSPFEAIQVENELDDILSEIIEELQNENI